MISKANRTTCYTVVKMHTVQLTANQNDSLTAFDNTGSMLNQTTGVS